MTTATPIQNSPYLPRQRNFPNNIETLSVEIDKTYIDIASRVNEKTIGLFGVNFQVITGEDWFLQGQPRKQQTLRQVYAFGTIAPGASLTIPHNIRNIVQFTRIYGTCITSQPDYRPIPYSSIAANHNIDLRVDSTSIVIANGGIAPTINSGLIILEWISDTATNS